MQAGIKDRYNNGKSDDQAKEEIFTEASRENAFTFDYLGSDFQADGDHKHAAIVRMGLAKSVSGNMVKIWKSVRQD